jgi:hypothetical protein
MSQNERLLLHLKNFGTIQPMLAWSQLGIYRLASRICDLRQAGHNIEKRMVIVTNRWGEEVRVAEYRLEVENAAEAHPEAA